MKYLFILLKSVRMTSKQEYLIAIYLFSPYLTNSLFFFKFGRPLCHLYPRGNLFSKVQFGSIVESWVFVLK